MLIGPLSIGVPWGLLALAALPAILAIHLFRQRSPPRPVTGLFLWPLPSTTPASGRRRERVVNLPSLWLELLAALALAWWLADVHPAGDDHGRHLVLVLDDRQRLQAQLSTVGSTSDTPAERIRVALHARLAALRANDRVTVIASGLTPRLLCGPAAEPQQALTALAAWQPQAAWHELEPALTLATHLAARSGAASGAELLLASDRLPPDLADEIGCAAHGAAVATSGLAEVRWLRDAHGERVVVRTFVSSSPAPRALDLRAGDRVLLTLPDAVVGALGTTLGTTRGTTLVIPLTSAAIPDQLTLALRGPDPLPFDDSVTLLRPPLREVRVALRLTAGGPLAVQVQRVLAAVPGIAAAGAVPDLVITDSTAAAGDAVPPGCWSLRIAPAPGGEALLGPFLRRAGHPLCTDLDGTGLLWVGGLAREHLAPDATELVSGGNQVLLAEQRRGRDRLVSLYTDAAHGTLLQHPFWPALLANMVEARRTALPGVASPNLAIGQPCRAVLPEGVARATLRGPDGSSTTLVADADGTVLIPALPLAGDWTLVAEPPAGGSDAGAAASASPAWSLSLRTTALDPRLGDLATAASLTREPPAGHTVAVERHRSPAELLVPLLLAAGAAIAAWICFGRGR